MYGTKSKTSDNSGTLSIMLQRTKINVIVRKGIS